MDDVHGKGRYNEQINTSLAQSKVRNDLLLRSQALHVDRHRVAEQQLNEVSLFGELSQPCPEHGHHSRRLHTASDAACQVIQLCLAMKTFRLRHLITQPCLE